MGAIAEAIVAYAEPLLDQTDGSMEQLNKALTISQLCWNLALLPEDERDQMVSEMRSSAKWPLAAGTLESGGCPFAKWPLAAGALESGGRRGLPWNRAVRTVSL